MSEVYLTPEQVRNLLNYRNRQSVYNNIHNKTFVLGVHYFKPTPKKILFKASAIKDWVEGSSSISDNPSEKSTSSDSPLQSVKQSMLRINI